MSRMVSEDAITAVGCEDSGMLIHYSTSFCAYETCMVLLVVMLQFHCHLLYCRPRIHQYSSHDVYTLIVIAYKTLPKSRGLEISREKLARYMSG